jgi:hypothetical protein
MFAIGVKGSNAFIPLIDNDVCCRKYYILCSVFGAVPVWVKPGDGLVERSGVSFSVNDILLGNVG